MTKVPVIETPEGAVVTLPVSSFPKGTREVEIERHGNGWLVIPVQDRSECLDMSPEALERMRRAKEEFFSLPASPDWPDRKQPPMQKRDWEGTAEDPARPQTQEEMETAWGKIFDNPIPDFPDRLNLPHQKRDFT